MNFRIPTGYREIDLAPAFLSEGRDSDVIAWPGAFAGVQF